jgi:hypothetical protein
MSQNILDKRFEDYLFEMGDERKLALLNIYQFYKDVFHYAAGSSYNHQAWEGGYADHIVETFRINELTYDAMYEIRPLPFTKDAALIALFFHDIEKPFRYGPEDVEHCNDWRRRAKQLSNTTGEPEWSVWEDMKWDIIADLEQRYKFKLSDEERNAIKYAHGEGSAHEKFRRVASPLAAHVGNCDTASARIWHDEGRGLSKRSLKP